MKPAPLGVRSGRRFLQSFFNFLLWCPIFPAGLELFHQQLLLWYFGISSLAWKSLAFKSFMSLWWPTPETKHFPVHTLCFFNVFVSEQASPQLSFFPELAEELSYKPHFDRKQMSLNYTHPPKNTSELWGDPSLGKSGIRICSELCRYPNNSTRPWNLKSNWNPYQTCSASAKPEFGNILILEHMTRVKCASSSLHPFAKEQSWQQCLGAEHPAALLTSPPSAWWLPERDTVSMVKGY